MPTSKQLTSCSTSDSDDTMHGLDQDTEMKSWTPVRSQEKALQTSLKESQYCRSTTGWQLATKSFRST